MTAPRHGRERGASYVEVLVGAAIISIALVPMLDALRAGAVVSEQQTQQVINHFALTARLEELLVEPYSSLSSAAAAAGSTSVPSSYSDSAGTPSRRLVFLSLYDGDNADTDNDPFTGTDDSLLWIRVQFEDSVHAVEALKMR